MASIKRINFTDGFSSEVTPAETIVVDSAQLLQYANDAAYVTANGAALNGSIYYNTTTDEVREYVSGAWRNQDYASSHTNTPAGNVSATTVQGAIDELDTEKLDKTGGTISGNLIVSGDLDVNGITTTINTTNLEITDKNININNSGSDASAEGAGINVERVSTDGSLVYEDALASKWKAGAVGSEIELANVSSAQDLSNKAIITPSRLDVKQDTKANLDTYAATASNGQLCFATDIKQMYQVVDSILTVVGGGTGGLDTVHTQDFETTAVASFTSGLNATYKTAGTFGGTLADETTNPISGTQSPKYTAGATSTNDWFDVETITLDDKQRSEHMGITLYADMTNFSTDAEFVVWDNTNSEKLTTAFDVLVGGKAKSRYPFSVYIPSNTASISYGFHMVTAPVSTEYFIADDFEFTLNPFVYKNILDVSKVQAEGNAGTSITANVTNIDFTESLDPDGAWSGTEYTVQKTGSVISLTGSVSSTTTHDDVVELYKNGVLYKRIGSFVKVIVDHHFSIVDTFTAGDVLSLRMTTSFTLNNSLTSHHIEIIETAEAAHVITPAQAYPNSMGARIANNGTATITSQSGKNAQDENPIASVNRTAAGLVDIVYTTAFFGVTPSAVVTSEELGILANIESESVTGCTIRTFNRSDGLGNDADFAIHLDRQDSDVNQALLLAAIPVQLVGYIKDVKPSGTAGGGFTLGSYIQRELNTTEGDFTKFGTLSSNQFTLDKGKYEIEVSAPAYSVNKHKSKLVADPSGTPVDTLIGTSEKTDTSSVQTKSLIKGNIEITTATTYEIQQQCNATKTVDGFGFPAAFGDDEIYTQVKITKLR